MSNTVILIILGVAIWTVFASYLMVRSKFWFLFIAIILASGYFLYEKFPLSFWTVFVYVYLLSMAGGITLGLSGKTERNNQPKNNKPINPDTDFAIKTTKGKEIIRDVNRGSLVLGGSGAGKTSSVLVPYLRYFAEKGRAGVIYDYKDGELTEFAKPLFKERLKIIAFHRPDITERFNIIKPEYLKDETDVREWATVLIKNLTGMDDAPQNKFFFDTASSLFSAVILKIAMYYPHYCSLPYVIAFLTGGDFSKEEINEQGKTYINPFGKLVDFITDDVRIRAQASDFLLGMGSAKQTASILSTLANGLVKICYPNAFWALSGNTVELNVNDPNNDIVLCVLNKPSKEEVYLPLVTSTLHMITKSMMNRGMKESFVMLDEAPTIKLKNMGRIVATMRSFGVATVYCAQDLAQGEIGYGVKGFQEIRGNLANQLFGQTKIPQQAEDYEKYFDPIKVKTKSVHKKSGSMFGANSSTSIGEKEQRVVRAHEFLKLKKGQFAFGTDGYYKIIQIPLPKNEIEKLQEYDNNIEVAVEDNFNQIFSEMQRFVNSL